MLIQEILFECPQRPNSGSRSKAGGWVELGKDAKAINAYCCDSCSFSFIAFNVSCFE